MTRNKKIISTIALMTVGLATGCQSSSEDTPSVATPRTLYVASGACFSGQGVATYVAAAGATSASKVIAKYDTSTGSYTGNLLDYNLGYFVAGTAPQNLVDMGSTILVSNENAAAANRALISIPKSDPTAFKSYYANATALASAIRGIARDADGSIMVARTVGVEKITNAPQRALANTAAWVAPTVGTCGVSNTSMTAVTLIPTFASGGATASKIIFGHSGITAATQRIGIVQENGWYATGDCLASQTTSLAHTFASNLPQRIFATNANGSSPTAMVYVPMPTGFAFTGKLFVTYANGQTSNSNAGTYNFNHGIASWEVNETAYGTVTLLNPVVVWDNASVVYGPSAIAYDAASSTLYVGVGGEPGVVNMATNNVAYNVEKFTVDLAANTLTRVSMDNKPFIQGTTLTKCISGLAVGD